MSLLGKEREDQQIMGLELLSIALGLSTFQGECAGRKVVVHSDNRGAEASMAKGAARSFDHCEIIHEMWTHAAVWHIALWVLRVGTEDNIADAPSRCAVVSAGPASLSAACAVMLGRFDYTALVTIGALYKEPVIEGRYWASAAWEHLKRSRGKQ